MVRPQRDRGPTVLERKAAEEAVAAKAEEEKRAQGETIHYTYTIHYIYKYSIKHYTAGPYTSQNYTGQ